MPGAVYRIISGSDISVTNQLATSSLDGWLPFGSINQSGSLFSILIGKGTGQLGSVDAQSTGTVTVGTSSFAGVNTIVYPPQSSITINTNPNVISVCT